jgi:transposase
MPRPRSEMRRVREVLRLYAELGANLSAVAAGAGLARSTVRLYLRRVAAAGIDATRVDSLSDEALEAALFAPAVVDNERPTPDWAAVDAELRAHKHVTRKLLWLEYKTAHPDGYEFSQFKLLLSRWQKSSGRSLSMRQVHRAGETVQVDYAGDTVGVMDAGVPRQAQIFVACLPCSGLIYAEATWTQGHADWLSSHIRLFNFLGGVTARVVPDNLKVGITHASYYDPVINASYAALIKHYQTAVVPARVRRPKDKPSVENGVLQTYRWLLAPLRHHQFFSLAELNAKLATLVTQFNDKPMAEPRAGSRRELFEAVERAALGRLPAEPYLVGEWKIECTVNIDYHIALERNFYSVPYAGAQGCRRLRDADHGAAFLSQRARCQSSARRRSQYLDDGGRAHAPGTPCRGQSHPGVDPRRGRQDRRGDGGLCRAFADRARPHRAGRALLPGYPAPGSPAPGRAPRGGVPMGPVGRRALVRLCRAAAQKPPRHPRSAAR